MGGSDRCYFFGCSSDCRCGRYTEHMVTGHRSEVQDTALLIYNGDRQFPLKLKVYFRLWLGLTCTCDLHLWAVSCDLRFGHAAVDVLTAINNDVNLDETRPIYFTWLINHRFVLREYTNSAVFILIGNFLFHFVYLLKYHVTLLLYHQSLSACKDDGYRSEIMNEVCFFAGDKTVSS